MYIIVLYIFKIQTKMTDPLPWPYLNWESFPSFLAAIGDYKENSLNPAERRELVNKSLQKARLYLEKILRQIWETFH